MTDLSFDIAALGPEPIDRRPPPRTPIERGLEARAQEGGREQALEPRPNAAEIDSVRRGQAVAAQPAVEPVRTAQPGEPPRPGVISRPIDPGAAFRAQEAQQSETAPAVGGGPRPPAADAPTESAATPATADANDTPANIALLATDAATPGAALAPSVADARGVRPDSPALAAEDRFDPPRAPAEQSNANAFAQQRETVGPPPRTPGAEALEEPPRTARETEDPIARTAVDEPTAELRRTADLIRPAGEPPVQDQPDAVRLAAQDRQAAALAAADAVETPIERTARLQAEAVGNDLAQDRAVGSPNTPSPPVAGAPGAGFGPAAPTPAIPQEQLFPAPGPADPFAPGGLASAGAIAPRPDAGGAALGAVASAVAETLTPTPALAPGDVADAFDPAGAPGLAAAAFAGAAAPGFDPDPTEAFTPGVGGPAAPGAGLDEDALRLPQPANFPETADPVEIAAAPPGTPGAIPATPFPEGVSPFARQQRPTLEVAPLGETPPPPGPNAGPASTARVEPGPQAVALENEAAAGSTALPLTPEPDRQPDLNRANNPPGEQRPSVQPDDAGAPIIEEPGVERDNAFADSDVRRGADLNDGRFEGGPDIGLQAAIDATRTFPDLDGEGRRGEPNSPALVSAPGIDANSPFTPTTRGPIDDVVEDALTEFARATRLEGPAVVPDRALNFDEPFPPGSDPDELTIVTQLAVDPPVADAPDVADLPEPAPQANADFGVDPGAPTEDPRVDGSSSDVVEPEALLSQGPGPRPEALRIARSEADPEEFGPDALASIGEPESAAIADAQRAARDQRNETAQVNFDPQLEARNPAAATAEGEETTLPQTPLTESNETTGAPVRREPVGALGDAGRFDDARARADVEIAAAAERAAEAASSTAAAGAGGAPTDLGAPFGGEPLFSETEIAAGVPRFDGPANPGGGDFASRFGLLAENLRVSSFQAVDRGVNLNQTS